LTFANTVEQFDAGDGNGGVVEVLEAEHGPGSGLDAPMILFDQIVQVFRRSQFGASIPSPRDLARSMDY
jgi:hypothetical protein